MVTAVLSRLSHLFCAVLVVALGSLPRAARAQEVPTTSPPPAEPALRLEVDMAPQFILMKGLQLEAALRTRGRWRFGLAAFTFQLPEVVHGQNGWTVRHYGAALSANVFLYQATRGGLFVGAVAAPHIHTYAFDSKSMQLEELDLGIRAGYQWFPSERFDGFLAGYLGVTVPVYVSDEPVVDGRTFERRPLNVFPIVALGWQFH